MGVAGQVEEGNVKILIGSYLFAPSVGGIETMSALMAEAFVGRGHEVRVVTMSAGAAANAPAGVGVGRRLSAAALNEAVGWCDVYWQNNLSLELWPAAAWGRPRVVTHQTWMRRVDGRVGWRDRVKRVWAATGRQIAISRAVAAELPGRAQVIPNCYDDAVFFAGETQGERTGELVFAGRLVSDKGVDLLIDALARLAGEGWRPGLTVVGDGPERGRLEARARAAGVEAQVRWAGVRRGSELAAELRNHRVMVVPSRWAEPFGIVALEGAACGCVVVGSRDGGLADAIGPGGVTYANGDVGALATALRAAGTGRVAVDAQARAAHLRRHARATVAEAYLSLFTEMTGGVK